MSDSGWIKLYRNLLEDAIWKDCNPSQKSVLITIMLRANHKATEWIWQGKKYSCNPGQFVCSVSSLANDAGVSVQSARSTLTKLKKYGFINTQTNTQGNKQSTLVTICNYGKYQKSEDQPNTQATQNPTGDQQAANKQPTTNKNERIKECKKKDISDRFDEFWKIYPNRVGKAKARQKWESKVQTVELADGIIEHLQERVKRDAQWLKDGGQYVPHPTTWLNGECWEDEYPTNVVNFSNGSSLPFSEDAIRRYRGVAKSQGFPEQVVERGKLWLFMTDGRIIDRGAA